MASIETSETPNQQLTNGQCLLVVSQITSPGYGTVITIAQGSLILLDYYDAREEYLDWTLLDAVSPDPTATTSLPTTYVALNVAGVYLKDADLKKNCVPVTLSQQADTAQNTDTNAETSD